MNETMLYIYLYFLRVDWIAQKIYAKKIVMAMVFVGKEQTEIISVIVIQTFMEYLVQLRCVQKIVMVEVNALMGFVFVRRVNGLEKNVKPKFVQVNVLGMVPVK